MHRLILGLLILIFTSNVEAQTTRNPYNLELILTLQEYQKSIEQDTGKKLIPLRSMIKDIALDIKYATASNVFYTRLYKSPIAMARYNAVKALKKVQDELKLKGVGLKIYDAYRPYQVTVKMFQLLPDTVYMGLPWKGSRHNRGTAFDLTLVDLKTGKDLKMPTPFDALVYASHPNFQGLPKDVLDNRELLKETMMKHGFVVDPVEWWHFNYSDGKQYELLDIELETLLNYYNKSRKNGK